MTAPRITDGSISLADTKYKQACKDQNAAYKNALLAAGAVRYDDSHPDLDKAIIDLVNAKSGFESLEKDLKQQHDRRLKDLMLERSRIRIMLHEITGEWSKKIGIAMPATTRGKIIERVAQKHGVTLDEMKSTKRHRHLVRARQEAYYLLYNEGKLSYPSVGRIFERDHTTVIHGYRRHEALFERGSQMTKVFCSNPQSFAERQDWAGCDGLGAKIFKRRIDGIKRWHENATPKEKAIAQRTAQARSANAVRPEVVAGVSLPKFSWDDEE